MEAEVQAGDAGKVFSQTVQVAFLKINRTGLPSVLCVKDRGDASKPAGWGALIGGGVEEGDILQESFTLPDGTVIEGTLLFTGWREFVCETGRDFRVTDKDLFPYKNFATFVTGALRRIKPSREHTGTLHEDVVLLIVVDEEIVNREFVGGQIIEANEIEKVTWFRLDQLPVASDQGPRTYTGHRLKLAALIRAYPDVFSQYGQDAEALARAVEAPLTARTERSRTRREQGRRGAQQEPITEEFFTRGR